MGLANETRLSLRQGVVALGTCDLALILDVCAAQELHNTLCMSLKRRVSKLPLLRASSRVEKRPSSGTMSGPCGGRASRNYFLTQHVGQTMNSFLVVLDPDRVRRCKVGERKSVFCFSIMRVDLVYNSMRRTSGWRKGKIQTGDGSCDKAKSRSGYQTGSYRKRNCASARKECVLVIKRRMSLQNSHDNEQRRRRSVFCAFWVERNERQSAVPASMNKAGHETGVKDRLDVCSDKRKSEGENHSPMAPCRDGILVVTSE